MKTMQEIFVFTKKTAFMQRLADLVRSGHCTYVQGEIPLDKTAAFVSKMASRYPIDRTKMAASRARSDDKTTARLLLLHQEADPTHIVWVLLVLPGLDFDPVGEKWRNAMKDKITLTGYELVRMTRPEAKGPAWTWKYTKLQHDSLRDALLRVIRTRRDDELRQLIHSLWRTPGFAGARAQVKKFGELIKGEWSRSRGSEPMPEIPSRLGFVQRLKDTTQPLSTLLAPHKKKKPKAGIETKAIDGKLATFDPKTMTWVHNQPDGKIMVWDEKLKIWIELDLDL